MTRYFWRCRGASCRARHAFDTDINPIYWGQAYICCPNCDKKHSAIYSEGGIGPDRICATRFDPLNFVARQIPTKCDGRCMGAKGPNCDCQCGGANHGANSI